jgi:hypothetical protein
MVATGTPTYASIRRSRRHLRHHHLRIDPCLVRWKTPGQGRRRRHRHAGRLLARRALRRSPRPGLMARRRATRSARAGPLRSRAHRKGRGSAGTTGGSAPHGDHRARAGQSCGSRASRVNICARRDSDSMLSTWDSEQSESRARRHHVGWSVLASSMCGVDRSSAGRGRSRRWSSPRGYEA